LIRETFMTGMEKLTMARKIVFFVLNSAAVIFLACHGPQSDSLWSWQGQTMGTTFVIKALPADSLNRREIEAAVEDVLLDVNVQMSTWIDSSLICQFNRSQQTEWFPVPGGMAHVFAQALWVSELSQGAFDITVAPLVDLWGFGPGSAAEEFPSEDEILQIKEHVGYQMVRVQDDPPAIRKADPHLTCDLAAIAKGYGVDCVAALLDSFGVASFFVEIGGEVYCRGTGPHHGLWHVGITSPNRDGRIQRVLRLTDLATATSGDYMNYFEHDGVRYSHTIDPRSGKPIAHRLASVTVVHASCTLADAMATAIDVLGPEAGYGLAVRENLAVLLIERTENGFEERTSPAFDHAFGEQGF